MHNPMPRAAKMIALAAAAVSTVTLLSSPAHAESATFRDRAGDVRGGSDLRSVAVSNGADNLRLTLSFRNLKRLDSSGAGASVYLDTDGIPGPEYVLGLGLSDGTDYQLSRTDSWDPRKTKGVAVCQVRVRLNYTAESAKVRIDKDCFVKVPGDGDVRVEVRSGARINDWLGHRRTFGPAVAQG